MTPRLQTFDQQVTGRLPGAALTVVDLLERVLEDALVGAYVYGSCLSSGLCPQSDLDILVLVSRPVTGAARIRLVAELLEISGWNAVDSTSRPLDVAVVVTTDVVPWRFPPVCDLIFGEWLRDDLAAQRIAPRSAHPDLAILFTTLLQNSRALFGPPAALVFAPVPSEDLHRAIVACLPSLLDNLKGDERNVILTLARMWVTLATNQILSKDQAAEWVIHRMPTKVSQVLELARAAYLGEETDDWSCNGQEVDAFVRHVVAEIKGVS